MIDFIRTKKGSSTVILALVFLAFALCIAGSVEISRRMVVKSECETFGRIWTKAILSEYDRNLLDDYGLMAYFGDEAEVSSTIDSYLKYSMSGRLNVSLGDTVSELAGYELGEPANFRKALQQSFAGSAIESAVSGSGRSKREDAGDGSSDEGPGEAGPEDSAPGKKTGRKIGNTVVLDTLPSGGMGSSLSIDSISQNAENLGNSDGIMSAVTGAGIETVFIWQHFGNYVTQGDKKESYFRNEWEYIISGKPDDDANYESCRKRLFLIRNALDLAALYKDPEKVELLTAVAETITPGPLGAVTQVLLAEVWAALEAEADLKTLYENGRVPVLKKADEWKVGLGSVLDSDDVRKKLDDESKELLDEKRSEINSLDMAENAGDIIREGLNYDEHLMLMILATNSNTRLLRIMDLVQINMKFRHYRDFNLMEYFVGVRYTIRANGRDYCFEDKYR